MKIFTLSAMFFQCMQSRLLEKAADGWRGWDKTGPKALRERLLDNFERKDWVDVANLAMILWAQKENKRLKKGGHDG